MKKIFFVLLGSLLLQTSILTTNAHLSLLNKNCAQSLANIEQELAFFNLGLKVFKIYKTTQHSSSFSVDVTLLHLKSNQELTMPTAYNDNNGECSRLGKKQLTEETFNAILLEDIMSKHGWTASPDSWWHFYWNDYNTTPHQLISTH